MQPPCSAYLKQAVIAPVSSAQLLMSVSGQDKQPLEQPYSNKGYGQFVGICEISINVI